MLDTILKRIPGVTVAVRTLVVVALLGVAACAPVKRRTFEDSSTEYSYHTVMYSGETLSIIARWYTGQSGNWEVLLDHNGDLDPRRLQIGDLVKIPQELLIRDESMPKAFVEKANAKVAQKSVPKAADTGAVVATGDAKPAVQGEAPPSDPVVAAQAAVDRANAEADAAAVKSEARTKTRDELLQELLQDQ